MGCTKYNWIQIKTGLKGILETAPLWKNTSKAGQNVSLTLILQFHKVLSDLKLLRDHFDKWNIDFSDKMYIEENQYVKSIKTVQN